MELAKQIEEQLEKEAAEDRRKAAEDRRKEVEENERKLQEFLKSEKLAGDGGASSMGPVEDAR